MSPGLYGASQPLYLPVTAVHDAILDADSVTFLHVVHSGLDTEDRADLNSLVTQWARDEVWCFVTFETHTVTETVRHESRRLQGRASRSVDGSQRDVVRQVSNSCSLSRRYRLPLAHMPL